MERSLDETKVVDCFDGLVLENEARSDQGLALLANKEEPKDDTLAPDIIEKAPQSSLQEMPGLDGDQTAELPLEVESGNAELAATLPLDKSLHEASCSAVKAGDALTAHELLAQGCSVECSPDDLIEFRKDPFLLAAHYRNHEVLKILIQHHPNPSKHSLNGCMALHNITIAKGDVTTLATKVLVKKVLEHGVPTDARTSTGITPLMACAQYGEAVVARTLLDHHADVHASDDEGRTALHHAVDNGNAEIAEI